LDPKKNVSFSLGMTLLEAGCMSSVQPCYPYGKNQEFNSEKLNELVTEFKNAYPDNSMLWDSVEH
jgi:PBP1b-binding outer membrane lipoprotein LpoB